MKSIFPDDRKKQNGHVPTGLRLNRSLSKRIRKLSRFSSAEPPDSDAEKPASVSTDEAQSPSSSSPGM